MYSFRLQQSDVAVLAVDQQNGELKESTAVIIACPSLSPPRADDRHRAKVVGG